MRKIWQVHRRGYGILLLHALRVRVCQSLANFGPIARQSVLWRSAAERAMQSAPRQSAADMIRPVRLGPDGDSASTGPPSSWCRRCDGRRTALLLPPAGPISSADSSVSRSCM